jgi:hypothetical protein
MQLVEIKNSEPLVRSLSELATLIREQVALADAAATRAAVPYWLEAGKLLNEAKTRPDMKHGEFEPWCKRHFPNVHATQRRKWMAAAREITAGHIQNDTVISLEDALRRVDDLTGTRRAQRSQTTSRKDWHKPVNVALRKIDFDALMSATGCLPPSCIPTSQAVRARQWRG